MSGRIRTIKPELLEDAVTAGVSHAAFRLYVGCVLLADDYGNFRADPRKLRGEVFWAHDTITTSHVEGLVHELWLAGRTDTATGLFYLYSTRRQLYGHIRNWEKHQKIDHPGKARIDGPTAKESEEYRPTPKLSRDSRESLSTDQDQDHDQDHDQDQRPSLGAGAPPSSAESPGQQPQATRLLPSKPAPSNPSTEPSSTNAPSATAGLFTLSTGEPESADATADAVRKVYEHYVTAWKRAAGGVRAPKLDEKRRRAVRGRLRENFTVEDLALACDGIFISPFHMGENERGKRYVDLELVCRDAKRVEEFMAIAVDAREAKARELARTQVVAKDSASYVAAPPEARAAIARLAVRPTTDLVAEDIPEGGSQVRLRIPPKTDITARSGN